MQKEELNIYVAGRPFAGAGTVAKIIRSNWAGVKYIDMNSLIDTMYADFSMIRNSTGQMRRVIKSSIIFKNAEYLYRAIGIPEFIAAQKMWQWANYIDNSASPIFVKRAIYHSMNGFNPNWRTIFVRQQFLEKPSDKYVICHALNLNEISLIKKPIIVWVECDEKHRYLHGSQSSQGVFYKDIYITKYAGFEDYCKKNASFVVYNNNKIQELELQVNTLGKSLGVKINGITFDEYYNQKKGKTV